MYVFIFANSNSNYARIRDLYIGCKNAAKTNKNIGELFVIQYYGHLKELFNFNKLAKLIYLIILI